jgi:class 3 adenylate cyclase
VLPSVRAPTLVLHRSENFFLDPRHGRYLAAHIPGARYQEVPGGDMLWWAGDADAVVDEIEVFVTGAGPVRDSDRLLATVLFTDIADSTRRAASRGDADWRTLLARHHRSVERLVSRYRGKLIKTLGDGVLATFDGPGRAIRCAESICESARGLGISVRAGLHTGEVEVMGEDIGGIAVHIAARVVAQAVGGEVLVSSSVPPLVVGSDLRFVDRGEHELKGVPGAWRLFALDL